MSLNGASAVFYRGFYQAVTRVRHAAVAICRSATGCSALSLATASTRLIAWSTPPRPPPRAAHGTQTPYVPSDHNESARLPSAMPGYSESLSMSHRSGLAQGASRPATGSEPNSVEKMSPAKKTGPGTAISTHSNRPDSGRDATTSGGIAYSRASAANTGTYSGRGELLCHAESSERENVGGDDHQ